MSTRIDGLARVDENSVTLIVSRKEIMAMFAHMRPFGEKTRGTVESGDWVVYVDHVEYPWFDFWAMINNCERGMYRVMLEGGVTIVCHIS